MRLVSVNAGLPREVEWSGKRVTTSIWKDPVEGRVRVSRLNLAGDRQSDLTVHGGIHKAVYVYPSEHYSYWQRQLSEVRLPWGAFGENLTVEGLREDQVQVGAHIRAGSAEFVVTQPRMPCFKLAVKFDRPDMVKRFLHSKRTGFYLAVVREGDVAAGDSIEYAPPPGDSLTIADLVDLYTSDVQNREMLHRASELAALPAGWREHFRERASVKSQG